MGGINVEYNIKERLSLKFEINYERKSQKADNNIEIRENFDDRPQTYKFTSKKNYDYLIIPVLLKYNFTAQNSFYVNGGPFLGYLLKSQITNNLNVPSFNSDDLDTTKDNKKVDFGLSFGLGKIIDLNNNKAINIELRENLGLSNTSNIDVWNGGNVKTNSINLIVGLIFN